MQPAALDPIRIAHATDAEAHLVVARDWMKGIEVLFAATPIAVRAFSLLGAQAVESLLAAFILTRAQGRDRNVVGAHDLLAMWRTASDLGLRLERPPPTWLVQVARGHKTPYAIRHQARRGSSGPLSRLHDIGSPNATELRAGVLNLETLVAPHVEAQKDDAPGMDAPSGYAIVDTAYLKARKVHRAETACISDSKARIG